MTTKWKQSISIVGALLVVGRLSPAWAWEALPESRQADTSSASQPLISYQGMLTDQNGNPVSMTTSMVFALYDAAAGGTLRWGPETHSVQVDRGLFSVLLGSVTPIDPASLSGDLFLDISVNGETLSPREAVTGVARAIMAERSVDDFYVSGAVGIGTSSPTHALEVAAGWASLEDFQLVNARGLQLTDWDDDTGGEDNKYRLLARDGAWQFYNGGVVVGSYANGTWSDLPNGRLIVESKLAVGTTSPRSETAVQIDSPAVPLTVRETDQSGAGSLWRMPLDGKVLRFDASQNGTDFSTYKTPLSLYSDGSVGCGALTETNLQTPEERAAGGSDRFEEGDVLCWVAQEQRLEKCATPNDRLVQAVADKGGRPIVIGAEPIKVLGPVLAGDLLVASEVPGYAQVNNNPLPGTVIAQALEDLDAGRGIIKAMIRKW